MVDVFLRRLQGEVRRVERGVEEERIGCMFAGMLFQEANSVVGNRGRAVVARIGFGERHSVEHMVVLGEEADFVHHGVGMVEADAAFAGHVPDVPFAGVVTAVAERLQILRKISQIVRDLAGSHDIARRLLRVLAGQQATARRAAARGGIGLRKAHAVGGHAVDVGRIDVPAVAAGVGVAHVVGQENEEVRLAGQSSLEERGCGGAGGHAEKLSSVIHIASSILNRSAQGGTCGGSRVHPGAQRNAAIAASGLWPFLVGRTPISANIRRDGAIAGGWAGWAAIYAGAGDTIECRWFISGTRVVSKRVVRFN